MQARQHARVVAVVVGAVELLARRRRGGAGSPQAAAVAVRDHAVLVLDEAVQGVEAAGVEATAVQLDRRHGVQGLDVRAQTAAAETAADRAQREAAAPDWRAAPEECVAMAAQHHVTSVLLWRPVPLPTVLEPVADLGQGQARLLGEGLLLVRGRVAVLGVEVLQNCARSLLEAVHRLLAVPDGLGQRVLLA